MKLKNRFLYLIFVAALLCCAACGQTEKLGIEGLWELSTVQSTENGKILAYSPNSAQADLYDGAAEIFAALSSENGKLKFSDKTSEQTFEGTYKLINKSGSTAVYGIGLFGQEGTTVVSNTVYSDNSHKTVLIISVGEYTLNFTAAENG